MRISTTLVCVLLLTLGSAACGDDDVAPLPDAGPVDAGSGSDAAADAGAESWRWEAIDPPAEGPIAVWGYMPVPMDAARAVFFGGTTLNAFGGGAVLDDVWQWDASGAAPTFTRLTPTGTAPSARYCGCGAYDPTRNRVLFFGGRDGTFGGVYDTWELDLTANTWSAIDTAAGAPPGAIGCALAYAPEVDAFYLFGGANESGVTDETWRYDPAARAWNQLAVAGPSARYDAILRHAATGAPLVMFAGSASAMAGPAFKNDVWLFTPEPPAWEEVVVAGDVPPGRRMPWMVLDDDGQGWLAGYGVLGLQNTEVLGDLWHFDLAARAWSVIDATDAPSPRGFAGALPAGTSGVGVLLGGFDNDNPKAEIWRLVHTGG